MVACILVFKELFSSSTVKTPAEKLQPIIDAFFHIYDTSGNGVIDTLKLQDIATGRRARACLLPSLKLAGAAVSSSGDAARGCAGVRAPPVRPH